MNAQRIEMDQNIYENRATLQIQENPEVGQSEEDLYQNSVPIRPRIDPYVLPKPLEKEARSKNDGEAPTAKWKVVAVVALILAIVGLLLLAAIAGIFFSQKSDNANRGDLQLAGGLKNISTVPPESYTTIAPENYTSIPVFNSVSTCKDLRHRGIFEDGIYDIGVSNSHQKVFCDMLTSGGGWTLVASVHDNNGNGTCTSEDKWANTKDVNGSSWTNNETFGAIDSVTEADYKNAAFYSMKASDVMIWQVPNGVKIDSAKASAKAIYHTENSVLRRMKYGGNLANLYKSVFSTYAEAPTAVPLIFPDSSSRSQQLEDLINSIPNWYNYKYDDSANKTIGDGGNDMFDSGNKVYYTVDDVRFGPVTYGINEFGDCTHQHQISTFPHYPFAFFLWIGNRARKLKKISVEVESNPGSDGNGHFATYEGTRSHGTSTLYYNAFNVYDAGDPSICGVIFYVKNEKKWNSGPPSTFVRDDWTTGTSTMKHGMVADGYPTNILMGYVLLSRTNGYQVLKSHVDNVMDQLLRKIYAVDTSEYGTYVESLAVPVRFTSGSISQIELNIPRTLLPSVSVGYIQFGSRAADGGMLAICPGVRLNNCSHAEHFCLGGIDLPRDASYCGDFTGWAAEGQERRTMNEYARSDNDLNSTFLLFVR